MAKKESGNDTDRYLIYGRVRTKRLDVEDRRYSGHMNGSRHVIIPYILDERQENDQFIICLLLESTTNRELRT